MTDFSPREIVSELDRFIVGQNDAKRAVAIALRNRWRRMNIKDDNGKYIIQYIILYNQIELLNEVIKYNIKNKSKPITFNLNVVDGDGRTVLYNCINYGNLLSTDYNSGIAGSCCFTNNNIDNTINNNNLFVKNSFNFAIIKNIYILTNMEYFYCCCLHNYLYDN